MPNPPDDRSTLRVAFWNTWLLSPRLWPGGPRVPGADRRFAPEVERRAPLAGAAVRGRFDVCALAEAFEVSEQAAVATAAGLRSVPGPTRRFPRATGSGLATLVDERRVRVVSSHTHRFRAGGDLRDADTLATKGALHLRVELDPTLPAVEVVSTHLFAGSGLAPLRGTTDTARHHRTRLRQVAELVDFVLTHRRVEAALLLLGDFNVPAHDPDPRISHPGARYAELLDALSPLGVLDVWDHHGVGPGHTCTFESPEDLCADPSEPDKVLDDAAETSSCAPGERIDYLWFAPPRGGARVTVGRPRRWAFAGRDVRGGPAGTLSDHLALSVTLRVDP